MHGDASVPPDTEHLRVTLGSSFPGWIKLSLTEHWRALAWKGLLVPTRACCAGYGRGRLQLRILGQRLQQSQGPERRGDPQDLRCLHRGLQVSKRRPRQAEPFAVGITTDIALADRPGLLSSDLTPPTPCVILTLLDIVGHLSLAPQTGNEDM